MSNDKILGKMVTKKMLIFKIRKRQLKFLGHIMREEILEGFDTRGSLKSRGTEEAYKK